MVVGEQTMKRGRVLTVGQLKALPDGARVWVRIKEHGEDFRRCDDALTFTRKDTEYLFPGMDFCLTDWDVPKGDDEKLDWSDDEVAISLASVRFVTVKTGRG